MGYGQGSHLTLLLAWHLHGIEKIKDVEVRGGIFKTFMM